MISGENITFAYPDKEGHIYVMHLTMSTDYAIRIIVYLSNRKYLASSRELSTTLNIPQSYVFKVLKVLQKAGLVQSCSGIDGGFGLLKRPEHIMLLEVMEATETTMKISRCLENDNYCHCQDAISCRIRCFYMDLQEQIEAKLRKTTIQDLMLT